MLEVLQRLVGFIVVLGPLVFIHELGHFLVAKWFKIDVPVFSLGFGPRLFGFRRKETDYRISLIPLGGYVRLAGDEADPERTGAPNEFLSRPRWQRFFVFVAGAVFNVLLAVVAMWWFFASYGRVEPVTYPTVVSIAQDSPAEVAGIEVGDRVVAVDGTDLADDDLAMDVLVGMSPNATRTISVVRGGERLELQMETGVAEEIHGASDPGWLLKMEKPSIARVTPGGPADEGGLQAGDVVVSANGLEDIDRAGFIEKIERSANKPLHLVVERAGAREELIVVPELQGEVGRIGVEVAVQRTQLGVFAAARESVNHNLRMSRMLMVVLGRLFTGEQSVKTLSGPLEIARMSKEVLFSSLPELVGFAAFLSLQLGILNLLPIPVLDGGHILILFIEGLMRRDLSEKLKERVMTAGFVFLLAFMVFVIALDATK